MFTLAVVKRLVIVLALAVALICLTFLSPIAGADDSSTSDNGGLSILTAVTIAIFLIVVIPLSFLMFGRRKGGKKTKVNKRRRRGHQEPQPQNMPVQQEPMQQMEPFPDQQPPIDYYPPQFMQENPPPPPPENILQPDQEIPPPPPDYIPPPESNQYQEYPLQDQGYPPQYDPQQYCDPGQYYGQDPYGQPVPDQGAPFDQFPYDPQYEQYPDQYYDPQYYMTPEEQEAAQREEEIKKRYGLPATGRYYPPHTPGQRGSYVYGSTASSTKSPFASSYRSYSSTIGMKSYSSSYSRGSHGSYVSSSSYSRGSYSSPRTSYSSRSLSSSRYSSPISGRSRVGVGSTSATRINRRLR